MLWSRTPALFCDKYAFRKVPFYIDEIFSRTVCFWSFWKSGHYYVYCKVKNHVNTIIEIRMNKRHRKGEELNRKWNFTVRNKQGESTECCASETHLWFHDWCFMLMILQLKCPLYLLNRWLPGKIEVRRLLRKKMRKTELNSHNPHRRGCTPWETAGKGVRLVETGGGRFHYQKWLNPIIWGFTDIMTTNSLSCSEQLRTWSTYDYYPCPTNGELTLQGFITSVLDFG